PRADAAAIDALIGFGDGVALARGLPVSRADRREVRRLLGVCRGSDRLPRGSLDRAVRYRDPSSDPGAAAPVMKALGLDDVARERVRRLLEAHPGAVVTTDAELLDGPGVRR